MGKFGVWDENPTLSEILERVFTALEEGVKRSKHPFHLVTVANVAGDSPRIRTVVLRRFWREEPRLAFHTHSKSPKAAELSDNPAVAFVFYDPDAGLQIRVEGTATLHSSDGLADEQWSRTTRLGKRCYLGAPAGIDSDAPTSGLPFTPFDVPEEIDEEPGRSNFLVVSATIESLDCLELDVRGHRRSRFRWKSGKLVESCWTTP